MASSDIVEKQPLKKEKEDKAIIIMEEDPIHYLATTNRRKKKHTCENPEDQCVRGGKDIIKEFELALIGRIVAPLEAIDPKIASFGLKPPPQEEEETTAPGSIYIDHSLIATSAIEELCTLANDNNGLLWTKSPVDGGDILDEEYYQQTFPRPSFGSFSWTEGSRASSVVKMEPIRLVDELTCIDKWRILFPTIVLEAIKIRVLFNGSSLDNPDGSLELVYTELQATTPFIPKREVVFLRTCKQIDESTWVVADVPIEPSGNVGYPSGCWVQGTPDGLSKVVWVEHFNVEQKTVCRKFYDRLRYIGFAFGAERWVACLERSCERKSYEIQESPIEKYPFDLENRYMMLVSQSMVCSFCENISPTIDGHPWSFYSAPRGLEIYATLRESPYYDDPKELVVVAAITFRLHQSHEFVFEILGDERKRHEWDMSGRPKGLTKIADYTTGKEPGNKIFVYQIDESDSGDEILQEKSVSRSGSLVVWSMVKYKKNANDVTEIMCLPLNTLVGFAVSHQNTMSSGNNSLIGDGLGGSYVTLAVQLRAVGNKPFDELEPKDMPMGFINQYMVETVRRVIRLLNKESAARSA